MTLRAASHIVTDDPMVIVDTIDELVAFAATTVTEKVTRQLMATTPKDTTLASVSWIPSIGQRSQEVGGTKKNVDDSKQREGLEQLKTYTLGMGQLFISNNVHYVLVLNTGWSAQAPAAFIESSIVDGLIETAEEFRRVVI